MGNICNSNKRSSKQESNKNNTTALPWQQLSPTPTCFGESDSPKMINQNEFIITTDYEIYKYNIKNNKWIELYIFYDKR